MAASNVCKRIGFLENGISFVLPGIKMWLKTNIGVYLQSSNLEIQIFRFQERFLIDLNWLGLLCNLANVFPVNSA